MGTRRRTGWLAGFLAAVFLLNGLRVSPSAALPDALRPAAPSLPNPHPHHMDHAAFNYYAVELHGHDSLDDLQCHAAAETAARDLLARNRGQIAYLRGHYLFEVPKELELEDGDGGAQRLEKRMESHRHVASSTRQVPKRRLFKRSIYAPGQAADIWTKKLGITDPEAGNQWHLYNSQTPPNDLNVTGAWLSGATGKGVVVSIIDDGLDYTSPDLAANFYLEGSWDFNGDKDGKKGPHPTPQLADDRHGTRCAGEVAAVRNTVCGVGTAFDARVSGIRILSGDLTEVDEATAITYKYQENHVYSCSWGPADDGASAEGPPAIVYKSFEEGIKNGRGGLGSIYVFATGNGGGFHDNCNYDGYTNSIWTITVGAIDRWNNHPGYAENCVAQLAVAYSSSGHADGSGIMTTDVGAEGVCTNTHGGTSAAAPLGAGIVALALSVRPDLTWRDMQRLVLETAVPINLEDPSWVQTAVGRNYSIKFGYGKLDAHAIVERARVWKLMGQQAVYKSALQAEGLALPYQGVGVNSSIPVTEKALKGVRLERLESVTVTVNIEHQRRGDLEIVLYSPHGVVSELAAPRPMDRNSQGLFNWTFSTVKHWDEDPVGIWTLNVMDTVNQELTGTLLDWQLTLYGETLTPAIPVTPPSSTVPSGTPVSTAPSGRSPTSNPPISSPDTSLLPGHEPPPSSFSAGGIVGVTIAAAIVLVGGAFAYRFFKRRRTYAEAYQFQMLGQNDPDVEGAFLNDDFAAEFSPGGKSRDGLDDFLDEEDDETVVGPRR